jgi:F-type H+-transporting ATPase subunit b
MLETLGIDFRFVLVMVVGFLLLFLILKKFAFGPIFGILQQRQDTIRGNLDEAESRRDEMVRLQHEYEERLAKIEDEARDKIQAAVKEAQSARDEILARAREESEAIVQRGNESMARERTKAMAEMRDQIANLAIQAASQVVQRSLDAPSHAALIDGVIAGIGQNGAGATPSSTASAGHASAGPASGGTASSGGTV